ncbi:cysteine proteinase inhibitor 1-like [Typha latifolia]|uniref:cysteine proteinase inhibitor 1-like n=1 Tax=Typha latifolia TaxID=4733 RepID=UPI003C2DCE70
MRSLPVLLLPLLLLLLLLLLHLANASDSGKPPLVGGWQPIKNTSDPHVQEIASFAVSEHNKAKQTDLVFQKVVKAESQVVAGTNYRVVVEAKDHNGKVAKYEAVVWEKTWEGFRQLTSFKPVKS